MVEISEQAKQARTGGYTTASAFVLKRAREPVETQVSRLSAR